ncbi:glycosyltransferase family 10 domain-containing protein [Longitalea arenae]|uniref:glycosyltransferase family 10 domain-containing protein n=1 Tax=Longitalea arenae TaxID=2812558 RepID=UPI001966EB30|nr:glycosyltransferase family 10 [Longitalea arenae]
MAKKKILLYNRTWDMKENEEYNFPIIDGFDITTEHRYFDEAVAVIFHMPTLLEKDSILDKRKKKKDQLWVFWSMECERHYQWQYKPEIYQLFDIKATYKLDSDVPVPYLGPNYLELLRNEPAPKKELINAFISSAFNQSNRLDYLKQLMSYVDVHSYGKQFNNKPLIDDAGKDTKETIISQYKFTVAFENAIDKDYVTEKFYDPLIAGSIPIYLGAPNIEELAPGEHCFINVHAFPSVKALADYLKHLDADENAYQEYMRWKKRPFKDQFMKMVATVDKPPLVSLCNVILKKAKIKPIGSIN